MPDQMFACPACGARTQIIRTEVPTDAFQLGPQTPEMSRMATTPPTEGRRERCDHTIHSNPLTRFESGQGSHQQE
jgi:hypothetical protein